MTMFGKKLKKTRAPIRPERWKPWAQNILAEMKADISMYEEYIEKLEENLTNVDVDPPVRDFAHHAGMMSRIDNSLRKLVNSHHAAALLLRYKSRGDIVQDELVVLVPNWKEIILKNYTYYNRPGYAVDTSFSQKFWNAFKECLAA